MISNNALLAFDAQMMTQKPILLSNVIQIQMVELVAINAVYPFQIQLLRIKISLVAQQ